jgi:hypothetical protein
MAIDRFFMMPNWFFDDGHLTAMGVNTFTVYMILVRHSNSETHECNPSYSSIQKKAKIGRTAISSAINYLVQYGYVEIVKTGNATQLSSIYKVPPFSQIKGSNQSHIGLVLSKTSPKKQPKPVLSRTATSPSQDCELVLDRTLNIQTLNIQIEKDKEEKEAETFFSETPEQNQAMQQEFNSADIADKQDPTPVAPAPLSEAAAALKAKFEAKFDRKANKYEPQGLTSAGYGEWHLGAVQGGTTSDNYNNWKPSLIAVAQKRKRIANQLDTPIAAADYIYNIARDCYREGHWGRFGNLATEAIAYEKALASNPTIKQSQDTETPSQDPTMPKVGEIDANGMVLMADCRWEHFYPKLGRFSRDTGEAQIVWGMDNTHPPDPVDERCLKFLAKTKDNPERLAKLLTAKHLADSDFASYDIQAENFLRAKDSLIAALNQEIQKLLLQSQAA